MNCEATLERNELKVRQGTLNLTNKDIKFVVAFHYWPNVIVCFLLLTL